MKGDKLRFLYYTVILYMAAAFTWWAILLNRKNAEAFDAKLDLAKYSAIQTGTYQDQKTFMLSQEVIDLVTKKKSQEKMIMGEAIVFILTLLIGIYLINRAYKKEKDSSTQRKNFLLSITHELKSPLASIGLVLDTFKKRDLNKDQSLKLTNNALKETNRLNELVDNLLMATKVDTEYTPALEKLDLKSMINEVISKVQTKYPNAVFAKQFPSDAVSITGDKNGLISLMTNLLENAVKYSPKTPKIDLSLSKEKGSIQLKVADQGVGIPDAEKKKVFDRFYRIGNEDTRKSKGTGLGLYIVGQIVKKHGGKIDVVDNLPKGTVFEISLPG